MIEIGSFVTLLLNPYVLVGLVLTMVVIFLVVWKLKFNKDPYFPFKQHQKILVIEVIQESEGLVFRQSYQGKGGPEGIYLNKINKLLPSKTPTIKGAQQDLLFLAVSPDGVRFPIKLTTLQLGASQIEILSQLAEAKINGTFYDEAAKYAQKIDGELSFQHLPMLIAIKPLLNSFQTMSDMIVKQYYQMVEQRALQSIGGKDQTLVDKLMGGNAPVWVISLALIAGVFIMGIGAFDALNKTMVHQSDTVANQWLTAQTQQQALLQWCASKISGDSKMTYAEAYKDAQKQLTGKNITKPDIKIPIADKQTLITVTH